MQSHQLSNCIQREVLDKTGSAIADLKVVVSDHEVTLSGTAQPYTRQIAVHAVFDVPLDGRSVRNNILLADGKQQR